METLKILGLDDDNHSPMFRTEDHVIFNNYKELVEFLSKPHIFQVEVRMFAIVDELGYCDGGLADFEDEEIDEMFNFLEGVGRKPEGMIDDIIFALFWNSANRHYW
jgi:hypothetical protein